MKKSLNNNTVLFGKDHLKKMNNSDAKTNFDNYFKRVKPQGSGEYSLLHKIWYA
ncbi:MAG: hypothetical protein GY756_08030 [bacterium]|nr:hypothetical protein [bacterium]